MSCRFGGWCLVTRVSCQHVLYTCIVIHILSVLYNYIVYIEGMSCDVNYYLSCTRILCILSVCLVHMHHKGKRYMILRVYTYMCSHISVTHMIICLQTYDHMCEHIYVFTHMIICVNTHMGFYQRDHLSVITARPECEHGTS